MLRAASLPPASGYSHATSPLVSEPLARTNARTAHIAGRVRYHGYGRTIERETRKSEPNTYHSPSASPSSSRVSNRRLESILELRTGCSRRHADVYPSTETERYRDNRDYHAATEMLNGAPRKRDFDCGLARKVHGDKRFGQRDRALR